MLDEIVREQNASKFVIFLEVKKTFKYFLSIFGFLTVDDELANFEASFAM